MNIFRVFLLSTLMVSSFGCSEPRELPPIVVERMHWWANQIDRVSENSRSSESLAAALQRLGANEVLTSVKDEKIYAAKLERAVSDEAFCGYEDLVLIAYFDTDGQLHDYDIGARAVCMFTDSPEISSAKTN